MLTRRRPPRSMSAVGYLSEVHCDAPGTTCSIWVRTDGEENVDAILRRRLAGQAMKFAPRIKNTNINIHFCGISSRRDGTRGSLPSLDTVRIAFLPEFTEPERVTFSSACAAIVMEGQ